MGYTFDCLDRVVELKSDSLIFAQSSLSTTILQTRKLFRTNQPIWKIINILMISAATGVSLSVILSLLYLLTLLSLPLSLSYPLVCLNYITTANFPLTDNCWTLPWQASPALPSHFAKKGAAQAAVTNHCKLTAKAHVRASLQPGWFLLASHIFCNILLIQRAEVHFLILPLKWFTAYKNMQ